MPLRDFLHGGSVEWRPSRNRVKERDPERIDIAAMIFLLPKKSLGGSILRRTPDLFGCLLRMGGAHRQTEIGNARGAVRGEEDIRRLDVSMQQPVPPGRA